jgi:TonB family protein
MAAVGVTAAGLGTFLIVRPAERSVNPGEFSPQAPISIVEPRIEAELTPFSTAPRETRVFGANEVDGRALIVTRDQLPAYPDSLRNKRQEGAVLARFVVGQNGRVDISSFHAERSTDALFTDAVKTYLAQTRFAPAVIRGRAVAQLVRMPFTFNLTGLGSSVSYGAVSNSANTGEGVMLHDAVVSLVGEDWVMSSDFMKVTLGADEFQPAKLKGIVDYDADYMVTRKVMLDGITTEVVVDKAAAMKIKASKDTLLQQYEYEIQRRK